MKGFSLQEGGVTVLQLGLLDLLLLTLLLGLLLLFLPVRIVDFILGGIYLAKSLSSGVKEELLWEGK